jgi:hypothetical protein
MSNIEAQVEHWRSLWQATVADANKQREIVSRIEALANEWDGWAHDDTLLAQTVVRLLRRAMGGVA